MHHKCSVSNQQKVWLNPPPRPLLSPTPLILSVQQGVQFLVETFSVLHIKQSNSYFLHE